MVLTPPFLTELGAIRCDTMVGREAMPHFRSGMILLMPTPLGSPFHKNKDLIYEMLRHIIL